MEDQKKKFLLSRIKKQQQLINLNYDKIKKLFIGKPITIQKYDSYLQNIYHLMELNNSLTSHLFEYLDKKQVEAVFERVNTLFNDLISKYKKIFNDWRLLEDGKDSRQIRQICEICHEKIESNRIQNLKKTLDEESECRTVMIRKLIEESEKERVRPLFTEDQDKIFRIELQKVFKSKQLMLQTNINQSNVFLQTVEEQIADFMINFRNEFADWEVSKEKEQQNLNWGKMMKGYVNKKLTNSFQNKIPSWIKKMHEMFIDKQPVKPKIYTMAKQIQTIEYPSAEQLNLKQELEETNNKLIIKREALKNSEEQIQHERLKSKGLKIQLQNLQKYFTDKLYLLNKDQRTLKQEIRIQKTEASNRTTPLQSSLHSQATIIEKKQENTQTQINQDHRRKKTKIAKVLYKSLVSDANSSLNKSIIHKQQQNQNIKKNGIDRQAINQLSKSVILTKQSRSAIVNNSVMDGYRGENEILRLKKKVYNRDKKDEINQYQQKYKKSIDMSETQLREEVKAIDQCIKKDLQAHKLSLLSQSSKGKQSVILSRKESQVNNKSFDDDKTINEMRKQNIQTQHCPDIRYSCQQQQIENQKVLLSSNWKDVFNFLHEMNKCNSLETTKEKQGLIDTIQKYFDHIFEQKNQSRAKQSNNSKSRFQKQNNKPTHRLKGNKSIVVDRYLDQKNIFSERKNKSLHSSKPEHQHKIKLPIISMHQASGQLGLNNYPTTNLSEDSLVLFIDQKFALNYEESFIQSHIHKQTSKPNPGQLRRIQELFSILQSLKRKDNGLYRQICSFIRYPFTSMRNKFVVIDIISQLSFSSFCNYFFKILWFHRQCEINEPNSFCGHIQTFMKKMIKMNQNITPLLNAKSYSKKKDI